MSSRRLIVSTRRRGGVDRDRLVEEHAREVLGELLSTRMTNTIRLTIKLRAGLKDWGECNFRDTSRTVTARSKHYTIVLQRDLPTPQMLRTLTHELKHLEQMATGRMAWAQRGRKGQKRPGYLWRPVGHTGGAIFYAIEDLPPWECRPWEIEARAAEARFHG